MSYRIGQAVQLKSRLMVEIVSEAGPNHYKVKCSRYAGPFRVKDSEIVTLTREDKLNFIDHDR